MFNKSSILLFAIVDTFCHGQYTLNKEFNIENLIYSVNINVFVIRWKLLAEALIQVNLNTITFYSQDNTENCVKFITVSFYYITNAQINRHGHLEINMHCNSTII
jgi:hypothetical protein